MSRIQQGRYLDTLVIGREAYPDHGLTSWAIWPASSGCVSPTTGRCRTPRRPRAAPPAGQRPAGRIKPYKTAVATAIRSRSQWCTSVLRTPRSRPPRSARFSKGLAGLLHKKTVRELVLTEGIRMDGRDLNTIRPITVEVGLLPRAHGSALFTRGDTQALTVATLGPSSDVQRIDTIGPEVSKRYLHHYNMPPYSTGENKLMRGPGRREIGHGALAERALIPVLPSHEEFPYVIRLVSECVTSNGSTSMASTCGSTLALMDAGVPIKAPVAGAAMGLVSGGRQVRGPDRHPGQGRRVR